MDKKDRRAKGGRIKDTSAFNIKQADSIEEISWSNNNSDHAKYNAISSDNSKFYKNEYDQNSRLFLGCIRNKE